jgi:hypothetical protein
MARKRKSKATEPVVTVEELPREPKELTSEEAEAAKGGFWFVSLSPSQQANDALMQPNLSTSPEGQARSK